MIDYSQTLLRMYKKARYPNLLAEHISGWCVDALACGANVSNEVMKNVLHSEDDLTLTEGVRLSKYIWCKFDYLFAPSLTVLQKDNPKHQVWVNDLMSGLEKLYHAAHARNIRAIKFMDGHERITLVNFELDFINRELVTYARYRRVKQMMEFALYETFGYPGDEPIRSVPIVMEKDL